MRDVRSRTGTGLVLAVSMAGLITSCPLPAWAGTVCFSNTAGDQFVLRGLGAKIGKKKSKPTSGYAIPAGGTSARPLSGSFVTNAEGTAIAVGFAEYFATVFGSGTSATVVTKFHQLTVLDGIDGKLAVGTSGTDCPWQRNSDGTTTGACTGFSVIDCKTATAIP